MAKARENLGFVVCIENKDCEDLEKRKIYQMLPDEESRQGGVYQGY